MPSNQDVRFIRKYGKIIPIRINREKESRRRGSALMGAGAAVTLGAGALSARLTISADKIAKKSKRSLKRALAVFKTDSPRMGMSPKAVNKTLMSGLADYKKVNRRLMLSKAVLRGGAGLGTGLFAAGALRAVSQEDRRKVEGVVGMAAGIGAYGLTSAVFKKLVERKLKL